MTTKRLALMLGAGMGTWLAIRALRARAPYDLRGKVVLITGGSRGLGLVLARQMAQEGANLAICARNEDELDRASQELAEHGARTLAVPCDLTDRNQVVAMIDKVRRSLGPVDVLVNNAGVISVGPVETMTLEDFQEAMQANFW